MCHLFGSKEEGGLLILRSLNSLPTILTLVMSSVQNTSLGGTGAGLVNSASPLAAAEPQIFQTHQDLPCRQVG